MTALDEVLKAEQEAESKIQAAETKSTEAVAKAKNTRKEALAAVEASFEKLKEEAVKSQQSKIEKTVATIKGDSVKKIESLRNTFSTKKSVLVAELRKTFIKS